MEEQIAVQEECQFLGTLIEDNMGHFSERFKARIEGANLTTGFFINRGEFSRVLYEVRTIKKEILEYLGLI